jgi:hypothetical protein
VGIFVYLMIDLPAGARHCDLAAIIPHRQARNVARLCLQRMQSLFCLLLKPLGMAERGQEQLQHLAGLACRQCCLLHRAATPRPRKASRRRWRGLCEQELRNKRCAGRGFGDHERAAQVWGPCTRVWAGDARVIEGALVAGGRPAMLINKVGINAALLPSGPNLLIDFTTEGCVVASSGGRCGAGERRQHAALNGCSRGASAGVGGWGRGACGG